jgi:hypothetical protein
VSGSDHHRPEHTIMASDEGIVTKDWEPAARAFVQQASPEQLQQIATGTTLARHPLASERKTEDLRKLITHEMKRHADFRGMVIRLIARQGFVSPPAKEATGAAGKEAKKETGGAGKEAKKETGGAGKEGQERKPKKEK